MKARTTIRLALRARLLTVASLPAAREFEGGARFERPDGATAYVREAFLPGVTRVEGLPAADGTETCDGVYLIDGFYPAGDAGLAAAEQFAADVTHAFRPGVPNGVLVTGDAAVRVDVLGASSARVLPAGSPAGLRQQIPITIRWRSQVPNAMTP